MRTGLRKVSFASIVSVLCAGTAAYATPVVFDFNSLANGAPATGGSGVNGSVQNYMRNVLSTQNAAWSVNVGAGAIADKNSYNGDGHVVGPGNGAVSLTLGNTEGATTAGSPYVAGPNDTYIRNSNNPNTGNPYDRITLDFTGGVSFTRATFDMEIFPDGSTGAGQPPDFQFLAGSDSAHLSMATGFPKVGIIPGTGGTYKYSPKCMQGGNTAGCGAGNVEPNAQLLTTVAIDFTTPVSSFAFIDWPPTIGIDNLTLTPPPPPHNQVPEPSSLIFLATAGFGLFYLRKRQQA